MSITIGAYDAKAHFSDLLDRASRGETITVSRHGQPVAQLVPMGTFKNETARRSVDEIRKMRSAIRLDGLSIRDLMYEGRR